MLVAWLTNNSTSIMEFLPSFLQPRKVLMSIIGRNSNSLHKPAVVFPTSRAVVLGSYLFGKTSPGICRPESDAYAKSRPTTKAIRQANKNPGRPSPILRYQCRLSTPSGMVLHGRQMPAKTIPRSETQEQLISLSTPHIWHN